MDYFVLIFSLISVVCARPEYNYDFNSGLNNGDDLASSSGHFSSNIDQVELPIVNKHFYLHSAPDDNNNETKQPKHFTLGKAQKNYRVVFIRAPASSLSNSQLTAQYAPQEEKTHIYVLSQKEHEINVNDIATPAPTPPSKPEVFFVKYQTPEEAEHAQKQIQAQYDSLGGSSSITDEGIAPHSSFVGSLGTQAPLLSKATYKPPKLNNSYLSSSRF